MDIIKYLTIAWWSFQLYKNIFNKIYKVFFTPKSTIDLNKMGKWCMITGCTQGIGKAYVELLAQKNLCIILVDFFSDKLILLSKELKSSYNIETKVIHLDLSLKDNLNYKKLEDEIKNLKIGILINNLCITYPYPEYFSDLHSKKKIYNDIIHCNIIIFTNICHMMLSQMVKRKKGVIINIASTLAVIPSPLMSVFAASKAYVLKFSKDLSIEYKSRGIIIQCLCPGSIATSTPGSFSEGWITPSPIKFVESAVNTIGKDNVTTGFFPHTILIGIFKLIYQLSPNSLIDWMITVMERNRRRALRSSKI